MLLKLLLISITFSFFLLPGMAFGAVTLNNVKMTTDTADIVANGQISLENVFIQGDGIQLQSSSTSELRLYNFFLQGSSTPYDVNFNGLSTQSADFEITTDGLTDARLTLTGTEIQGVKLDDLPSSDRTFAGGINTILVNAKTLIHVCFPGFFGCEAATVTDSGTGGGGGDSSPPSFTQSLSQEEFGSTLNDTLQPITDSSLEFPLSIDGKGFALTLYSNKIVTNKVETDAPAHLRLLFRESDLQHVALYINLRGMQREIANSDTYIIYDGGQIKEISDPHGYFSDVKLSTIKTSNKYVLDYDITFKKPMEKSDLIVRAWDANRNSADTKILDAIEVIEAPPTTTTNELAQNTKQYENTVTQGIPQENSVINSQKMIELMSQVEKWGGYSSESISDKEMLNDVGIEAQHIPKWFKEMARWTVHGSTSMQEFVDAINYLYKIGAVK